MATVCEMLVHGRNKSTHVMIKSHRAGTVVMTILTSISCTEHSVVNISKCIARRNGMNRGHQSNSFPDVLCKSTALSGHGPGAVQLAIWMVECMVVVSLAGPNYSVPESSVLP